jgi:carboxylesterase type B
LDRRISWEIQSRWLAFMQHGDPNSAGLTPWPRVYESSTDVMVFDSAAAMRPAVSSAERWEALQSYVQAGGTLSLF